MRLFASYDSWIPYQLELIQSYTSVFNTKGDVVSFLFHTFLVWRCEDNKKQNKEKSKSYMAIARQSAQWPGVILILSLSACTRRGSAIEREECETKMTRTSLFRWKQHVVLVVSAKPSCHGETKIHELRFVNRTKFWLSIAKKVRVSKNIFAFLRVKGGWAWGRGCDVRSKGSAAVNATNTTYSSATYKLFARHICGHIWDTYVRYIQQHMRRFYKSVCFSLERPAKTDSSAADCSRRSTHVHIFCDSLLRFRCFVSTRTERTAKVHKKTRWSFIRTGSCKPYDIFVLTRKVYRIFG